MYSVGVLQARSASSPITCCRCHIRAMACNSPLALPRHTPSTFSQRPAGRPAPEQHSWVCQATTNTELQQAPEANLPAVGSRWVATVRQLPQDSWPADCLLMGSSRIQMREVSSSADNPLHSAILSPVSRRMRYHLTWCCDLQRRSWQRGSDLGVAWRGQAKNTPHCIRDTWIR